MRAPSLRNEVDWPSSPTAELGSGARRRSPIRLPRLPLLAMIVFQLPHVPAVNRAALRRRIDISVASDDRSSRAGGGGEWRPPPSGSGGGMPPDRRRWTSAIPPPP